MKIKDNSRDAEREGWVGVRSGWFRRASTGKMKEGEKNQMTPKCLVCTYSEARVTLEEIQRGLGYDICPEESILAGDGGEKN